MLNTYISTSVSNGYYVTRLDVRQSNKFIDSNQSEITYRLYTTFTASSGAWNNPPYGLTGKIVIGGKTITIPKTPYNFNNNKVITWSEGRFNIPHNADGSKTITAYFSVNPDNDYFSPSSKTSGNLTLETIPRASDFTLNKTSSQLDSEFIITLTPASSAFTHKVYFEIGSKSSLITTMSAGNTRQNVKPSTSYWQDSFSGISTTGTVRIETYNGSTKLGERRKTLTIISNPDNVKPSLGISVTAVNGKSDTYYKGVTAMKVVLNPTYKYGAKHKAYSVTIKNGNNIIYSGSSGNFTTPVYNITGTVTITASVTDTRGYVGTVSTTVTYNDYFKPYVTSVVNKRVNASGSDDMIGDFSVVGCKVVFKHNIGNTLTYKVEYKESSSSSWVQVFNQTGINTNTYNKTQRISTNSEKKYDLRITLSDTLTTNTYNYVIEIGKVIVDIHNTGEGLGIGTSVGEANLININTNWSTIGGRGYTLNNVDLDTITKQGVYTQKSNVNATSIYNYPEQEAGTLEVFVVESEKYMLIQRYSCWNSKSVYTRSRYSTSSWGRWISIAGDVQKGLYSASQVPTKNNKTYIIMFPRPFIKIPIVVATISSSTPQLYSIGVYDITTHGFKLTVYNGHTASVNVGVSWIATSI